MNSHGNMAEEGREDVFECRGCGECCRGEGGIFIAPDAVEAPARLLGVPFVDFVSRYTEPRHGLLSLKTDQDGYCLLLDRRTNICLIHAAKPVMCRDWPFFYGPLHFREGFEAAKNNCPGIRPEVTWEEFVGWHNRRSRYRPPASYLDELKRGAVPDSGL
ncbi:MAG: YkgJ family cysteine cluster protein [Thermodesulfobacteriota bacterium]